MNNAETLSFMPIMFSQDAEILNMSYEALTAYLDKWLAFGGKESSVYEDFSGVFGQDAVIAL